MALTLAELARRARELFRTAPWTVRLIQPLRVRICPLEVLLAAVPERATVLDIGCGAGLLLGLLAPRITAGVGVDTSATAITTAQRMTLPTEQAARLSFALAWPSATFSVVALIDVLHHVAVERQRELVEAAAARVAPSGILLFKDIPPRPRWRALMNRLHDLVLARQWVHHRSGDAVARWLVEAGLQIERRARYDRWWYAHELIIARRVAP